MQRSILITRPLPAALRLRTALALRGYTGLIAPVMQLQPCPTLPPSLTDCAAVLFTSAAAIEHLPYAALPASWPDWRCYCVGDHTANQARQRGWRNVISAAGDAKALATLIQRQHPQQDAILYPCGQDRHHDPEQTLRDAGYYLRLWEIYQSVALEALSAECQLALQQNRLAAVTLFSPRAAEIFSRLAQQAGCAQDCAALAVFCLSPAIAALATSLPWRGVITAEQPHEAALLDLIAAWLHTEIISHPHNYDPQLAK